MILTLEDIDKVMQTSDKTTYEVLKSIDAFNTKKKIDPPNVGGPRKSRYVHEGIERDRMMYEIMRSGGI